ncbi:MAG: EAL domain-containing protein [Pseudomonadota bacterium]
MSDTLLTLGEVTTDRVVDFPTQRPQVPTSARERPSEADSAEILNFPTHANPSARMLPRCDLETVIAAIAESRIETLFQRQVDLRSGEVVAVEALARLRDARGALLDTATAIEQAEIHDVIGVLGRRVAERALYELAQHQLAGLRVPRIALNVSPLELCDPGYNVWLLSLLDDLKITSEQVELELTERTCRDWTTVQLQNLDVLAAQGVTLVLDDFGVGFSNWDQLKALPISGIKLDPSLTFDIERCRTSARIVAGLRQVADDLDLRLVIEGVESHTQLSVLRSLNCRQGQGFLFGRPAPLALLLNDPSEA